MKIKNVSDGNAPRFFNSIDALPISVFPTNAEVGQAAAADAAAFLQQTIRAQGHANVILATGNSQLTFLESLRIVSGIDWSKVNVFHMDEYINLKPGHPASFPTFLRRHFLDHLRPPAGPFSRFRVNAPRLDAANMKIYCVPIHAIFAP